MKETQKNRRETERDGKKSKRDKKRETERDGNKSRRETLNMSI